MIKQSNELAYNLGYIDSNRLGKKEDRNEIEYSEYHRKKKYEQKQMRDDNNGLKGLETCKVLVCSVLDFGIDHINKLKMKELRMLLCYHFSFEKLKGSPKKA